MQKITTGMIGRKSGKLTVIKMSENQETNKEIMWTCICECGNYVDVAGSLIRSCKTKSCGCSNRMKSLIGERFGHLTVIEKGHGIQKRIYDVWSGMIRRCYSPDHLSYVRR